MNQPKNALIVGASRNIGLAVATELADRGWNVVGTVRRGQPEQLRATDKRAISVEHLDITEPVQIAALKERLAGTSFDLLFVNAGIADEDKPVSAVSTDVFVDVMVTNALSPLRVVEGLRDLVTENGTIGVMSSRQGSVSFNTKGGHEVYRASKSALNQLMRSYAARSQDDPRTLLLLHPGWVQTELGGPGAQLTVEQSAHGVVNTIVEHAGDGGLQFLDYQGQVVPW